jgi:hypothetical protein
MNNQFATQFLLEEMDAYDSLRSMLAQLGAEEDSIKILVKAVEMGALKPSEAVKIVKKALSIGEMSSTGGGVTGGPTAASWDPQGPTGIGDQMATTKAFGRKRKYQEGTFEDDEIAVFDGGEDGLTKIYKKADGTYYGMNDEFDFVAKDKQEILRKLSQFGYKHLSGNLEEDAPRLAGDPSKTNKQGSKNLNAYSSVGFTKAPGAEEAGKKIKGVDVKMLWKESAEGRELHPDVEKLIKHVADRALGKELHRDFHDEVIADLHSDKFDKNTSLSDFKKYLVDKVAHFADRYTEGLNESRAYSKFKRETATRSKDQQMHEAVRMIHSRLAEVSKLLEYAQQMRKELSEGEQTLEYNHNTKKVFERINSKVVEIYSKTRQLK